MDPKKYFEELKRRKVFRSALAYLAVAWVLIEVASVVLPTFDIPPIVLKALIILLVLGFPVNLVFSWVYDVTPEGLKKTDEIPDTDEPSKIKGRRLNRIIIGFLSLAVILLLYNQFGRSKPENNPATVTVQNPETAIKTIAVMPFADNSPLGDHKWLTAGMVDAINNNLINIEGLRVIASRSIDRLASDSTPSNQIAEALQLTHFLEGSVLRIENNIRINVRLISADDYSQNWSRSFDQDMDAIYEIIDEVATSVGRELHLAFNDSKVSLPSAERTTSTAAYDLYLKARYEGSKYWGKQPPIIREYLEKAIELDSTFYAAHAALGLYWSDLQTWDGERSDNYYENIRKSNDLLKFVIENAPSYGDSYLLLSNNKIFYEQDFRALALAIKGFELNPSTFNKLILVNVNLAALGEDPTKTYEFALEAMEESPFEPGSWAGKGLAEYFVGKHKDAFNTLEEGLTKFSEGNLSSTAVRVYYWLRHYDKVVRVAEQYFAEIPGRPARMLGYLAAAHYKLGNLKEYESLMEELRKQAATSPIGSPAFHLAMVSAQTGNHEAAFNWLDKAIADKEVELYWLKVEPPFKPLYDDPRWDRLIDEMGFNDIPKVIL